MRKPVNVHARKVLLAAAIAAASVAGFCSTVGAANLPAVWVGPNNGLWSAAANWAGGLVPNNNATNTFDVFIDNSAPASATVNLPFGIQPTINNLTIDPGHTLNLAAFSALGIAGSSINNAGTINLNQLSTRMVVSDTTLTGGGTITLATNSGGSLQGFAAANRLTNVNNTIRGGGFFGSGQLLLTNQGVVVATEPATNLRVDLSGTLNFNSGTMRANGGTLLIYNSTIDNSAGTIEALAGSVVRLQAESVMSGGTLRAVAGGTLENFGDGTLVNVNIAGRFHGWGGTSTALGGTITNTGTLDVGDGTFGGAVLRVGDGTTVTLGGGGTVNFNWWDSSIRGAGTFITDNTIRGAGLLGNFEAAVVSNNLVSADLPGEQLTIATSAAGGMQNNGIARAINGGTLEFVSTNVTNTGTVVADNASTVTLSGSRISGGTITTAGSGVIRSLNYSAIASVTNAGRFVAAHSTDISGTITNTGSISVNPEGAGVLDRLNVPTGATATLTGGGFIHLNGDYAGIGSFGTLVNLNNTIRGQGAIGDDQTNLVNHSLIAADVSGQRLYLDAGDTAGVTNSGTIRAENGGTLQVADTSFLNSGTIAALNGSTISLTYVTTINGGTLVTDGSGVIENLHFTANSNTITLQDLTNRGHYVARDGSTNALRGTVNNVGLLNIGHDGFTTYLDAAPAGGIATLTGGGTASLNGTTRVYGAGTFVNANNTITGTGELGLDDLAIRNAGVIEARANFTSNTLTIDPGPGGFVNTGTLRVRPGARLVLVGGGSNEGFDLTGGTLHVMNGGTIAGFNTPIVTAGPVQLDGRWDYSAGTTTVGRILGAGTLNVTGGTLAVATNGTTSGTSRVQSLSITGSGRFDLKDNDLIVGPATPRTAIEAYAESARNGGAWNGVGLTSSAAQANPSSSTGLGVLSGAEYTSMGGGTGTFSGLSYTPTDTLVKYTWNGDTNFSGTVNFDDYVRVDVGFNTGLTGWSNGDFNYSGAVNFDDYVLIDVAFNTQSGTLGRAIAYLDGTDRSESARAAAGVHVVIEHFNRFGLAQRGEFLAAAPEPGVAIVSCATALWIMSRGRRGTSKRR